MPTLGADLFDKDPDATLDYPVDWSAWLPDGDSISSVVWTVPAGLTQPLSPPVSLVGAVATVWLSGGTLGETYAVACKVTTAQFRVDERTILIRVVNR